MCQPCFSKIRMLHIFVALPTQSHSKNIEFLKVHIIVNEDIVNWYRKVTNWEINESLIFFLVRLNKKYYTRYVVCLLVSNSHSYTKHHQRKSRELWISKHSINLPRSTRKACSPICSNMSRVSSSFFFVLYKKFVIFFKHFETLLTSTVSLFDGENFWKTSVSLMQHTNKYTCNMYAYVCTECSKWKSLFFKKD